MLIELSDISIESMYVRASILEIFEGQWQSAISIDAVSKI